MCSAPPDSPPPVDDSLAALRGMSDEDLARVGDHSLREHLRAQAQVARVKHAPLTPENLDALLHDPDCLRHPVRLVFEFGNMSMHQFAEADIDWRNTEENGRVLYLRPLLHDQPNLIRFAVAYMIPTLNYGDIISDEHCLLYGSTLLELAEDSFYQEICTLAEVVGATPRFPGKGSCGC